MAHDCGLIVNPDGLKQTIEGNIVQGTSRALWEEVRFEPSMVTSVDWATYPILDITERPAEIDIVLISDYDKGVCTPQLLRQVIDDVALLVHLAALNERSRARVFAHRRWQRLAAVENVQTRHGKVHAALDQLTE
mgnify:CR=1 FL=1